jgi:hypothetical protein
MKNEYVCRECNTNGINDISHTISHKDLSPDLRVNGNIILKYLLQVRV